MHLNVGGLRIFMRCANSKETLLMKKFLFWTSLFCTTLVCIFMWTKFSLNGYKADFYFFLVTLFLNLFCFGVLSREDKTRRQSFINLSFAALQIIALCIFLWSDTLQVEKVYEPRNNKYNLYSSLSGWYKRAYFKQHRTELCNDGELWETKVPYYFPVIEIETSRDQCHKVRTDSSYAWLYMHVPE
jgi:hypothetical protein